MKSFASQKWWDEHNTAHRMDIAPVWDLIRKWIEHHARGSSGRALEIGCYPGRYLALLAEMGFEVSGVDLSPGTDTTMAQWLAGCGYKVGTIACGDYFQFPVQPAYDLVISLGFLEHFEDWPSVLQRHAGHLRPGGKLLVCCPNFAGALQHRFRRWLDPENLARHNLKSMDTAQWAPVLEGCGCRVLWRGHFGRFAFHVEPQRRTLFQRAVVRGIERAAPTLRSLLSDRAAWSPYCGIVAQRLDA